MHRSPRWGACSRLLAVAAIIAFALATFGAVALHAHDAVETAENHTTCVGCLLASTLVMDGIDSCDQGTPRVVEDLVVPFEIRRAEPWTSAPQVGRAPPRN